MTVDDIKNPAGNNFLTEPGERRRGYLFTIWPKYLHLVNIFSFIS
jgi:hypothetical protein